MRNVLRRARAGKQGNGACVFQESFFSALLEAPRARTMCLYESYMRYRGMTTHLVTRQSVRDGFYEISSHERELTVR